MDIDTLIRAKKPQKIFNLRTLRISLKYRPKIYKLILKMRQRLRKKTLLIIELKQKINLMEKNNIMKKEVSSNTEILNQSKENVLNTKSVTKASTQTDDTLNELIKNVKEEDEKQQTVDKKPITEDTDMKTETAWNINGNDGKDEKSIAEQVKEVAQNALQQTGMVYVESAGMYYDYKTGYYYNSELGLYYHPDTGCYYYYSDEKKMFVFHSYPDRSAENASLKAHEIRKAKKHKKAMKTEEDIEKLTKNLSQGNEEDTSKPKRRKKSNKKREVISSEVENKDKVDKEDLKSKIGEKEDENGPNNEIEVKNEEKESKSSEEDLEDGECSETGSECEDDKSDASTATASDDESVARHHPPCMRIIVRETNLVKLKVGNLFLVTKDGGTLGREGDHHTILIRDTNVSRSHLHFVYDDTRRVYMVTDLGSKNGTILNGSRMSESQIASEPMEVLHGSTIQLGETKLLCHIHPGNDTCGHCEPGLVMETLEKEKKIAYTRTCSVQKQHQLELARLKNKYAPQPLMIEEKEYNDRAKTRREHVGSSHHSEKTQSSDLETSIAPENKGFKLLQKMGWSKGEGLGKDNQGETEPIPLISNEGKAGLGTPGSTGAPPVGPTPKTINVLGKNTLRLAARSKMLNPPAKAFQDPTEDEESE